MDCWQSAMSTERLSENLTLEVMRSLASCVPAAYFAKDSCVFLERHTFLSLRWTLSYPWYLHDGRPANWASGIGGAPPNWPP